MENNISESEKIKAILELNRLWINGDDNGKRADLSKANLREADLRYADLRYANLSKANLSNADLRYANLSKANLSKADLSKANLRYANLSKANLSEADLSNADLRYANLSEADLSNADLSNANLSKADLSKANLRYADLSKADLSEANLSNADLSGANLSEVRNILSPILWLTKNFEKDEKGDFIVYKRCGKGKTEYAPPERWVFEEGAILTEVVNPLPTLDCACGVNFGTRTWVEENYPDADIWECRLDWQGLATLVVPYSTDGKARTGYLRLVKIVE